MFLTMSKLQQAVYKHVSASSSDETIKDLSDEDITTDRQLPQQRRGRRCAVFFALFVGSVLISVIVGFFLGKSHGIGLDAPGRITDCGGSPAEARELGCKFDPMMQKWLPLDCYDEAHSRHYWAEMTRSGWYHDADLRYELDDTSVSGGELPIIYAPPEFHRKHCTYSWELTLRSLGERRPILEPLMSVAHIRHCNSVLLGTYHNRTEEEARVKPTKVALGFLRCASYQYWLRHLPN